MGLIKLSGIRVYAFHGCLQEEARIGSEYRVDVAVEADLSVSSTTDELLDTIDYVVINRIVVEQMTQRSKLLEHVGKRIVKALLKAYAQIQHVEVEVTKINPPINGDVREVTVYINSAD